MTEMIENVPIHTIHTLCLSYLPNLPNLPIPSLTGSLIHLAPLPPFALLSAMLPTILST